MKIKKENFLSILASTKPEDITALILKNSKIKPVKNVIVRYKGSEINK